MKTTEWTKAVINNNSGRLIAKSQMEFHDDGRADSGKTANASKKYSCHYCPASYLHSYDLTKHVKKKHRDEYHQE